MRLKISFANYRPETYLPINTNYHLVKLINSLTFEYKRYLSSLVHSDENRQNYFDMYTFSQLIIPARKIDKYKIGILSQEFYWYVASPYYQFLGLLAKELRTSKKVTISKQTFGVNAVNFVETPVFEKPEARFTCLSPVAVYRQNDKNKKHSSFHLKSGYILPEDGDYLSFLERDLINKYNAIKKNKINELDFDLQFDQDYIRKKKNRITKVITLENGERIPEQVRGVLAPLHVKASPEVLGVIYDVGLGQLNNYGFGMVETIHANRAN